jgi:hypothetical protein
LGHGSWDHGGLVAIGIDALSVNVASSEDAALRSALRRAVNRAGLLLSVEEGWKPRSWTDAECWHVVQRHSDGVVGHLLAPILRKTGPTGTPEEAFGFGRDYVGWEAQGQAARFVAEAFVGLVDPEEPGPVGKATRVDCALDFECDPDDTADDVVEAIRPHLRGSVAIGCSAEREEVPTRYVGSRTSKRRLRIYRKDLAPNNHGRYAFPVMRLEYQLRDEEARRYWGIACQRGLSVADSDCAHALWRQTGVIAPDAERAAFPPELRESDYERATAAQVARLYGWLAEVEFRDDWERLRQRVIDHGAHVSRMTRARLSQRLQAAHGADPATVWARIDRLLAASRKRER